MPGSHRFRRVGPFFDFGLIIRRRRRSSPRLRAAGRAHRHRRDACATAPATALPDAMIEIWQANAAGKYRHPDDQQIAARSRRATASAACRPTSSDVSSSRPWSRDACRGRTAPAGAASGDRRARARPSTRLVTRMYFEDEPANERTGADAGARPSGAQPCARRGSPTTATASTSCCRGRARRCSSMLAMDAIAQLFGAAARVQAMLDVEAALAEAEAGAGVIPAAGARRSRAAARVETLRSSRAPTRTQRLRRQHRDPARPPPDRTRRRPRTRMPAAYVHWGATSQDIIDTASCFSCAIAVPVILRRLRPRGERRGAHAERHATTPMAGRTWLQQATPITFGLKAAGWLDALDRVGRTLAAVAFDAALVLQFGGASGTLAALGEHGPAVARGTRGAARRCRPGRSRGTPTAIAWRRSRARWASRPARRKDRPRCRAARADRSRRSARGRRGDGAARRPCLTSRIPCALAIAVAAAVRAPGWWRRCWRRCRRSTSAVSAAGRRSGTRCPSSSPLAATPRERWRSCSRGWSSIPSACRPTLKPPAGSCLPKPWRCDWRQRWETGGARARSARGAAGRGRASRVRGCARGGSGGHRGARSVRASSRRCDPRTILGQSAAFVGNVLARHGKDVGRNAICAARRLPPELRRRRQIHMPRRCCCRTRWARTHELWAPQVEGLSSVFRLIRYDTRGHGASSAPDGPYSIEMLGLDALASSTPPAFRARTYAACPSAGSPRCGSASTRPTRVETLVLASTAARIRDAQFWEERIDAVRAVRPRAARGCIDGALVHRWLPCGTS